MPQFIELDNLKGNIESEEAIEQLRETIESNSNSGKKPDETEINFMLWLAENTEAIKVVPNVCIQGNEIDFIIIFEKHSCLIEIKKYNGSDSVVKNVKKQIEKDIQMQSTKEIDIHGFGIIWDDGVKEVYKYLENKFEKLTSNEFLEELKKEKSYCDFKRLNELNKIKRFDAYSDEVVDLLDSVEKNEFVLSEAQDSVLDSIRNKIKHKNKVLLNIPIGCGKTLILIKYIKELLDNGEKVFFISLNDKELRIDHPNFYNTNIEEIMKDDMFEIIPDTYYLTDEIQVMQENTYKILLNNGVKLIGMGDIRLQLKNNKLIDKAEYEKSKFKLINYRNHPSINNFINSLTNKEMLKDVIEDENRISLYKVDNIPDEDKLNEYSFIVRNKYDYGEAIRTLGLEYDTVNIFLSCSLEEYREEKDFSIRKKLIIYASRAIKRLNIYCTDINVLYELKKLNNKSQSLINIKTYARDILDKLEKENVRIDFVVDGFHFFEDFRVFVPNEINKEINKLIDKNLSIKQFNNELDQIFKNINNKLTFFELFQNKSELKKIAYYEEQNQYIEKVKWVIKTHFKNQFAFLEENDEK